jgi:hypothetical protein
MLAFKADLGGDDDAGAQTALGDRLATISSERPKP